MIGSQPHYLLFCNTQLSPTRQSAAEPINEPATDQAQQCGHPLSHKSTGFGRWQFVLERLDGPERLEVADSEAAVQSDRLALLAVVRGLEALEQPSHVSLVTTSRYVSRGLKYGLSSWREADYQWESFGVRKPIRNADLWQRIDQALSFHGVNCKLIQTQFDLCGEPGVQPVAARGPSADPSIADDIELGILNAELSAESVTAPVWTDETEELEQVLPQQTLTKTESKPIWRLRLPPLGITCGEIADRLAKIWWTAAAAWLAWWRKKLHRRPVQRSPRSAYFAT